MLIDTRIDTVLYIMFKVLQSNNSQSYKSAYLFSNYKMHKSNQIKFGHVHVTNGHVTSVVTF